LPRVGFSGGHRGSNRSCWNYYKLVATGPADEAFIPLDKSACPMVKKG
jgi:hypothetical protein